MVSDLKHAIKSRNTILFVGAGLSATLGLPNWQQLIDKMAKDLNFEPSVFSTLGGYLELAEYYISIKGIGPLRSWMDREWHSSSINIKDSNIHKCIVDLNFPIIYTTNYDRWIENAYDYYCKPYIKISDVHNLTEIRDSTNTQIIKFHGDFDNDPSIVLSESSYFERLDFETPLDIKLRADVLGKSILFIGYSLSDINLRYLLYKLNKLWKTSTNVSHKPTSYIYLTRPNPVQEKILSDRGITPIISEVDDAKEGLLKFLEKLR
ncbi:Sir2 family NAD-dependent protein deacetylase [Chitinophagaceae bacterium IBVUCB1]|nr:Sir2 family NAD-dependent protein deacetylase [Chitinophagaceae bacterium IBVUCB1]